MNKSLGLSIVSLILLAGLTAGELELGSAIPLPDVKMLDVSGKEISLNDVKGENGLLVIFSCNTCPWVDAWEDRYLAVAEKLSPLGVGIVAINPNEAYRDKGDGIEDMKKRAGKMGYNFYYALDTDSQLAKAFGATRTPHIFLFDKEGALVYRGAIDDNAKEAKNVKKAYLTNAVDEMLAGKPVTVTSTKALGCAIKFPEKL